MRTIIIEDYNPKWPLFFQKEVQLIKDILSNEIIFIEHIGSTAIVGLSAKPIIDILIAVKDIKKIDSYNTAMYLLHYIAKGEFGIKNRRFFLKPNEENRKFHVHIFQVNDPKIKSHIDFKNYLQAHPFLVQQYSNLKKKLAKKFPHNIEGYIKGKSPFIKKILHSIEAETL